jgi:UDP-glucuronate 4-epimerase
MSKSILITGCSGFIGFHLSNRLLADGYTVTGFDNMNDYYEVALKQSRLRLLQEQPQFTFHPMSLDDHAAIDQLFREHSFDAVINLAAQAGVRYSLQNPRAYIDTNIMGFTNILEACRVNQIEHLIYASSSSVYGANTTMPFSEHHPADHPLSLYAATKKANELMAHSYSHLYGLPTTGLRFFTVYGPWGRPDMAYFIFAKKMMEGLPIQVFNYGQMMRDFTYVDDIVEAMVRLIDQPPSPNLSYDRGIPDPASSYAPYRIYNIGNNKPAQLMHVIRTIEACLHRTAVIEYLPMQAGDVEVTFANIDGLAEAVGFSPATSIEEGMKRFADWFLSYYY